EQIKLQVALINPFMHVKGFAAQETKAAIERAHLLINKPKRSESLPKTHCYCSRFSTVYGPPTLWRSMVTWCVSLRDSFLALAEKQGAIAPLMTAHRIMGISLVSMGDIAYGRAHLDRALALYDPATHRSLATRFGMDAEIVILSYRSQALWLLGYPDAALRDA